MYPRKRFKNKKTEPWTCDGYKSARKRQNSAMLE